MIWQVGNGCSIKIWEDPWIPRGISRLPATPKNNMLKTVSDLINPVTGQWDEGLIRDTRDNFNDVDSACILAIPTDSNVDDRPAWHFDSKGLISVKSAYSLFKCKQIKKIWRLCGQEEERIVLMEKITAFETIETLLSFRPEKIATIATLLWCWWCERNSVREGKRGRTSEDLAWTIKC
jgi:hypothetical protein